MEQLSELRPIPTLDQIAAEPSRAADLPLPTAQALLSALLTAQAALWGRLLSGENGDGQRPPGEKVPNGDQLLTVEEAAKRLGTSKDWLYRRTSRLPFTVRLGRQLRFSCNGLNRYIQQRKSAENA